MVETVQLLRTPVFGINGTITTRRRALDTEKDRIAVRMFQGLHGHEDRFIKRLIHVLRAQAEREVRGNELVAERDAPGVDVPDRRELRREPKLFDRGSDDLHHLSGRDRDLREELANPAAHTTSRGFDDRNERGERGMSAEFNREAYREAIVDGKRHAGVHGGPQSYLEVAKR